jgi:hypothetical protein
MTIRHISASTATTTDAVVKVWKKQTFGPHPGLDTPLPKEQAEHLLTVMAQPTTRRTPEAAQAAAQLLAEFRASMHQNGHMEAVTPRTVTPPAQPKPVQHRTRTAKQPEIQPITPEPVKRRFVWPELSAYMLDIVYLSTIATAVYGLWFTLREMGAAFAVPYCLISWHALRMAKNPESRSTAQVGIAAVVVLEVLTFFVHLVLFNLRTVQAAKAGVLPFEYSFYGTLTMPFVIACILAGLFSAAGIYAVSVTFLGTSEKHALAEKAKRDAEQSAAHVTELRAALEDAAKQWAIASGQNHFDTEKAGTLAERYYTILKNAKA